MSHVLRTSDLARTLAGLDSNADYASGSATTSCSPKPRFRSASDLIRTFPHLREPVLQGLLRQGESMNLIAPAKRYKTFFAIDLGLSVATGRSFLDTFDVPNPGPVLYIDNELHPETMADRLPKVVAARGINIATLEETLFIESLRGRLVDIHQMNSYFQDIEPGRFKLIILDALYRFFPNGVSENDNASIAQVYNTIDRYAERLGSSFVLVHHASKGSQVNKDIVDVGAGGGSQSRAADLHLVLRPHVEPDAVVIEAANRSWPPVSPRCLRWQFPVWNIDTMLDPTQLKPDGSRRSRAGAGRPQASPKPRTKTMSPEEFVAAFVTDRPQVKEAVILAAVDSELSRRAAIDLIAVALEKQLIFVWSGKGANKKQRFATIPAPKTSKTSSKTSKARANSKKPKKTGSK